MALGILSVGGVIHRVQTKIEWGKIIFEFLGEKGLPIAGISEDALIQFFSVVERLRVSSPRDSAERDKPIETRTRQSLQLNVQSWTRIVTEVLDQTALSVETIPEDVLIQILKVVYEMRIHPENPDLIAEEPTEISIAGATTRATTGASTGASASGDRWPQPTARFGRPARRRGQHGT